MYTPVNPSFTIYVKVGVRGSRLHGHVSMMQHTMQLNQMQSIMQFDRPFLSVYFVNRNKIMLLYSRDKCTKNCKTFESKAAKITVF